MHKHYRQTEDPPRRHNSWWSIDEQTCSKSSVEQLKKTWPDINPIMMLVANNTIWCKKPKKEMTETIAYAYSSKSTQPELSNEYQHDRA